MRSWQNLKKTLPKKSEKLNRFKTANFKKERKTAYVAVLDSGAGGLAILKKLKAEFYDLNFLYVSDRRFMPYGNKTEEQIITRCKKNVKKAIKLGAVAIVVACNTMSRVGNEVFLKCGAPCFFVQPDLKVLCAKKRSAENSALFCTNATALTDEIKRLAENEKCSVFPQKTLAKQIEKNILKDDFNYCIDLKRTYNKTDFSHSSLYKIKTVYLSCTHYILIKDRFEKLFENAKFYDGSEKLSQEIKKFLKTRDFFNSKKSETEKNFRFNDNLFNAKLKFAGSGKLKMKRIFSKIKNA